MNNIEIDFIFPCTNCLLLTAMFILLAGALITTAMMSATTAFIVSTDTPPIAIKMPERPLTYTQLETLFYHTSAVTKMTIRTRLRIDFWFMPCAYLFLLCLGFYIKLNAAFNDSWNTPLSYIVYLPLLSWLFDLIENITAIKILDELTHTNAKVMYISSILKWLTVFVFIGFLLALLVTKTIES